MTWAELAPELLRAIGVVAAAAIAAYVAVYRWKIEERHRADRAEAQRLEKVRKTAIALRADLAFNLRLLKASFDPRYNGERLTRYRGAIESPEPGDGGLPIGVSTEPSVLFELNKPNLNELPETLTEALVTFYQSDRALARVIEAMADGRFDSAAPNRRKRVVLYYHLVGEACLCSGLVARARLDAFIADDATRLTDAESAYLTEDERALLALVSDSEGASGRIAALLKVEHTPLPPDTGERNMLARLLERALNQRKDRTGHGSTS